MYSPWKSTHLVTCRCFSLLMMFARFIDTLPFQQTVGLMCWTYHSHDDAPQNRSVAPSPVNVNPNHSPSYHSPAPYFTPIFTPPLPTWLHMMNNSEDDTQVLDFAVPDTQHAVTFLLSWSPHSYSLPGSPAVASCKETHLISVSNRQREFFCPPNK